VHRGNDEARLTLPKPFKVVIQVNEYSETPRTVIGNELRQGDCIKMPH